MAYKDDSKNWKNMSEEFICKNNAKVKYIPAQFQTNYSQRFNQ